MNKLKLEKSVLILLVLLTILLFVDFSQRLLVLGAEQKRDFVDPPFDSFQLSPPYVVAELNTLAEQWRQAATTETSVPDKSVSVQDARQLGDVRLLLMAIYTEGEYTALFRYSTLTDSTPKLIRLKTGGQLEQVTVSKIERHQVTLNFAGEDSVFKLFRPKQTNSK